LFLLIGLSDKQVLVKQQAVTIGICENSLLKNREENGVFNEVCSMAVLLVLGQI